MNETEQSVNVNVYQDNSIDEPKPIEVILRKGDAVPVKPDSPVNVSGTIDAPLFWIRKRKSNINPKKSHVIYCKEERKIKLVINEGSPLQTVIEGKLELSPEYLKLGINAGTYRTPLAMSEFIKLNRSYFENRQLAMELTTQLKQLKAKVDNEIEKRENPNTGEKHEIFNRVVRTNIPESFNVNVPIFTGQDKKTIEVETYFNPADLTVTLVSPEAVDYIHEETETIINGEIEEIAKEVPELVIIEQ